MRTKLRGTTTYPQRRKDALNGIAPLIKGRKDMLVVNVGPGLTWKPIARLLPPEKKRHGIIGVRDTVVKYMDRIARKVIKSGKHLITFEPFEIAKAIQRAAGEKMRFGIVVVDNKPQTRKALENNPEYKQFKKKLEFVEADIQSGNIPKDTDLVFATAVLPYVNRETTLRKMAGALKKGGVLVTDKLSKQEQTSLGIKYWRQYGSTFVYLKE